MAPSTTIRLIGRRIAVSAVAALGLAGAFASPALATPSEGYSTMEQCQRAQSAFVGSSFVRVTRSCYLYTYRVGGSTIVWAYRFNYEIRPQ